MYASFDYFTLRLFLDGMLFMMACYAICSFWLQKKRVYLFYALYIIFLLLNLKANDYKQFDTPTEAEDQWAFYLENLFQSFALFFYFWFASELLILRQTDRLSFRITQIAQALLLAEAILDTILWLANTSFITRYGIYMLDRYIIGLLAIWAILRLLQGRDPVRILFLTGTSCFLFAALYAISSPFLPTRFFVGDIHQPFSFPLANMQVGVVLEVLFFTLGLSLRNHLTEREKIRYQSQLIEQLQENERKQTKLNSLRDEIANDLHDEIGSQLSSISILSQSTARYVDNERAIERLLIIGQTARQVMESMREIVWSLNSSGDSLQDVGLRIRETAYKLFADTSIGLYFDFPQAPDVLHELTAKQRRELHLIAKECLNNIIRHADAKHIGIRLKRNANHLKLTITDDGIGFDNELIRSGLGLNSIQQRAERLNASLEIESELCEGTTITIVCPLAIHQPERLLA